MCDLLKPRIDPNVIGLSAGFGGGIGQAGCLCGALSGAIMVLGLVITGAQRGNLAIHRDAGLLLERFVDRFGDTCCRLLNGEDFTSFEHFKRCYTIASSTAVMTLEYLVENNYISEEVLSRVEPDIRKK